jgi:hypothetical protein
LHAVHTAVLNLSSRIDQVLQSLGDDESAASAFFLDVQRSLAAAGNEADLLNTFLTLSTTAFHGFAFPAASLEPIDALLAEAEQIAFTFMAGGVAH